VAANITARKPSAPRYLPSTICVLLIGADSSISKECLLRSSENMRIEMAGAMNRRMTAQLPKKLGSRYSLMFIESCWYGLYIDWLDCIEKSVSMMAKKKPVMARKPHSASQPSGVAK